MPSRNSGLTFTGVSCTIDFEVSCGILSKGWKSLPKIKKRPGSFRIRGRPNSPPPSLLNWEDKPQPQICKLHLRAKHWHYSQWHGESRGWSRSPCRRCCGVQKRCQQRPRWAKPSRVGSSERIVSNELPRDCSIASVRSMRICPSRCPGGKLIRPQCAPRNQV